ncbi:MAG: hypothetical protein KKF30_08740 [Proteobacteria bacterium]|nr:hypothetical protein [Pseudomonadota bacterium]MBU4471722.1 hypothetical protein [Pseudomonadota bacterium]MCG2750503.1 hypothetical protein [Desulfobacteraceae bacterium]
MEQFLAFLYAVVGMLIGGLATHFLGKDIARRNEFKVASDKLKDAFLDDLIKFKRAGIIEIEGTKIYDVIIKVYGKHCAAVERFAYNLKGKQLISFYSAWHEYQYPDNKTNNGPFGYYITPDETGKDRMIKPEFITHKIASIIECVKPK